MGNLSLFAHALSVLSGQSLARVERVLQDNRGTTFNAMYTKAGLPVSAVDVFRSTISVWRAKLAESDESDHHRLPYLVTREVMAGYEGERDRIVDDLMLLLRKICTDAARDSARSRVEALALAASDAPLELPAPEPEVIPDLTPEELEAFAWQFAEELADAAIADEMALEENTDEIIAANQDRIPASLLAGSVSKTLIRAA